MIPKTNKAVRSKHAIWIASIAVALALLTGLFITSCGTGDKEPHIILISIDTLRHDHVGWSGHKPDGLSTTPFIDTLAEKGTVFSQAVSSSSWTLPGHYAMLTGLPDELHEMYDDRMPFDPKVKTMAEQMKAQGYATGGFFSGPYLHSFFGLDRGFDMYESCMSYETTYDVMKYKGNTMDRKAQEELVREKEVKSHLDITSKAVVDKALFFAKTHRNEKMFLFLHFFDVHNDYIPPDPFNKRFDKDYKGWVTGRGIVRDPRINKGMKEKHLNHIKALYDGEISWVDHNISRFFTALDRMSPDILENSLVIVTADHGEEFFDHENIGHRWNLHGECIRIPLLFWWPGHVGEGKVIDDPVRIYDILPTVEELAGIPISDQTYGRSLAPVMHGAKMDPEPILSELTYVPHNQDQEAVYFKHVACQFKDLKLISVEKRKWSKEHPLDFAGEVLEENLWLFNVKNDPEERTNLAESEPELTKQILAGYRRELDRQREYYVKIHGEGGGPKEARDIAPEMLESLRNLGYVDGK